MLSPDTKFSQYRIVRRLGSGATADVYEAIDERLGRRVALKVLPSEFGRNPSMVERFETEVRAAASLNHHGIVSVFEVGHDQGLHFFAMRLLIGGNLRQRIDKGLTQAEALTIVREVAGAFGHAHARGLVHRDIKPENIIFDEQGYPVLTDFGVAKALEGGSRVTATAFSAGTPRYISPEQARGLPVDARTDLYSLGVVLYEMLTGRPPYEGDESLAIIFKHVTEPVPRLPETHSGLQPLLDALMAKDPAQRPGSAGDLITLIDRKVPAQPGRAERPDQASPPSAIDADAPAFAEQLAAQVRRQEVAAVLEEEVRKRAVEQSRGSREERARREEIGRIKDELQALQELEAEPFQSERLLEDVVEGREEGAIAVMLQEEAEGRRKAEIEQRHKEAARKQVQDQERQRQAEALKLKAAAVRKAEAERRQQADMERLTELKHPAAASAAAVAPAPRAALGSRLPGNPLMIGALMLAGVLMLGGLLWWQLERSSSHGGQVAISGPAPEIVADESPVEIPVPVEQPQVPPSPEVGDVAPEVQTAAPEVAVQEGAPESITQAVAPAEAPMVTTQTDSPERTAAAMPPAVQPDQPPADAAAAPTSPVPALEEPIAQTEKPAPKVSKPKADRLAAPSTASAGKAKSGGRAAADRTDRQCEEIFSRLSLEGNLSPAQREFMKENC
jgi:tRNA A-37 threonylcarbamoyl transferase component Bud32